jgi:hypothetical protein
MRTVLIFCLLTIVGCAGQWDLYEENDIFKPDKNRDANYTQGLVLTKRNKNHSISFIHQFYTPDNLRVEDPPKDERPYAGLVAGEYSDYNYNHEEDYLDIWRLRLGGVGSCSMAKDIQKAAHNKVFNGADPQGWDSQLRNEPVVGLTLERNFRGFDSSVFGLDSDVIFNLRGDVGNINTNASGQALFRIGHNIPRDLAPVVLSVESHKFWKYFFFAGSQTKVVGYNALLEGSMFRDDPDTFYSKDIEHLVTVLKMGFHVEYGGKRIMYTWNRISPEWEQSGSHSYGSLNFGWIW